MRTSVCYIRSYHSRHNSKPASMNETHFKSSNHVRVPDNILTTGSAAALKGHFKSSNFFTKSTNTSGKKSCQNGNSTLAIIQEMLKGIVKSGASFAKSIKSVIVADGQKNIQENHQTCTLEVKKNGIIEIMNHRVLPCTSESSSSFHGTLMKNGDLLTKNDPSLRCQTSPPCKKRRSDTLLSTKSSKKRRYDASFTFRISDKSRISLSRKNTIDKENFPIELGEEKENIPTRLGKENENIPTKLGKEKENIPTKLEKPLCRRITGQSGSGDSCASLYHMKWFLQLLESPVLSSFLDADICCRYADNYLLAMVFAYFVRSQFSQEEYNEENFFAALYLAHDMEEDEEELKYEVFPWALGKNWHRKYSNIIQRRDTIFWKIDCRAVVSKKCCDQVMDMAPNHRLWTRVRPDYHGGARREYMKHPDENGYPRGPLKSPLQCQQCLEQKCMESSSSFLLYISESESSIDEELQKAGQTEEHKDSGFGTFLGDATDEFDVSSESCLELLKKGDNLLKQESNKKLGELQCSETKIVESNELTV